MSSLLRNLGLLGILLLISFQPVLSSATTDGHTKAFIVVKHLHEGTFFIERVPVIGCYGTIGMGYGPQLAQFTASYKASSNVGCGGEQFFDEINYLTCAQVSSTKISKDYQNLTAMTLDISKCDDKNDPQLITMIRTAAKLNFSPKGKEIEVTITK